LLPRFWREDEVFLIPDRLGGRDSRELKYLAQVAGQVRISKGAAIIECTIEYDRGISDKYGRRQRCVFQHLELIKRWCARRTKHFW
jgi:hypothetical protein